MREGINDPSVLFDFPVHVGARGRAGHPDERDRLASRDVVADRHERRGRVVVAALEAFGMLHADPASSDLYPARRVDNAVIRGDDDRAVRRGDVDAGVAALKELADRTGDGPDEAPWRIDDAAETRARGGVGAQVDALTARHATSVDLELRLVETGAAHAREPAAVVTERAGAEEIGERCDRLVLLVRRIPDRDAVERIPARDRRGHRADEQATVGRPPAPRAAERR